MDIVKLPIEAKSLADALTQLCEQLTSTITHQVTESVREELRADRESRESREDGQIPKFLTVDEYCKGRRTLIPADSIK